ncbi:MAG: ABC transporter [Alkalinema sp. CACIAM 70d]|nr:MAG: ABC transporter [Alkalinema sp. CACIAM 70d]
MHDLQLPPPLTKGRIRLRRRQLIYYRDLLWELVVRDLKLLYKRSLLGVAWTLLNPLLQLVVFSFVFRAILRGLNIEHYISYAFSGILIWTWTQTALFHATGLITGNRPLIRQPGFPVAILPIVTVTTGLIHFLLALPALCIFLFIEQVQLSASLFLFPIAVILQFLLTLSLAYPLAALNVTFRDTQHTLGVLLQLLFYLLPIFYTIDQVPAAFRTYYRWNPLVILIDTYRAVLIDGQFPQWTALVGLVVLCSLLLPIGYQIFKHQSARFVEEV